MDEVGRAWGKQDKCLEVFGENAGIKCDKALVVRSTFCT